MKIINTLQFLTSCLFLYFMFWEMPKITKAYYNKGYSDATNYMIQELKSNKIIIYRHDTIYLTKWEK